MAKKNFLFGLILLFIFIIGCAQQQTEQPAAKPASINEKPVEIASVQTKNPTLKIISPNDGDLIKSSSITVKLQVDNFELVPVGQLVKNNEGHFHVWLDSEKKLGPQTEFTFENITSGKHTITAELVKSDHSSLSPKITQAITINVKSDFVPKVETQTQQQAGLSEFDVEADDNGFYPNIIKAKINDKVTIHFKFRDSSIYFAGLDVKGPFPTLHYKLNSQQPLTASFVMKEATRIDSYWPSSGVHKATLNVEVAK